MISKQIHQQVHQYRAAVFFLMIVLVVPKQALPQDAARKIQPKFEFGTGLNLTCIKPPGSCDYFVPFIQVNYLSPTVFDVFSFKGGVEFTYLNVYSENVNANRYTYLKPKLLFQIPIGQVSKFGAGLQGSVILNKKNLDPYPDDIRDESGDLESTLDYLIGFDVIVRNKLGVGLKVSVSLTDPDYKTKCFQLSFNYVFY